MDKKTKLTPMMAQYQEIKKQCPDCLLFYRMGDFYELFYEDAVTAAEVLNITLTKRDKNSEIQMCGVPVRAYNAYLIKLIKMGYKVAICEQVEDVKQARAERGTGALVKRDIVRVVTQGTLIEDELLDGRLSNNLVNLIYYKNQVCISWYDISTSVFHYRSFDESDNDWLLNVYNFLKILHPTELLIDDKTIQNPSFYEIFMPLNKLITTISSKQCIAKRANSRLKSIYNVQNLTSFGDISDIESMAVVNIIDYIETTHKQQSYKLDIPRRFNPNNMMILNESVLKSLEILRDSQGHYKGSFASNINTTKTNMGNRLLNNDILFPLCDIEKIKYRQDITQFFIDNKTLLLDVREQLSNIADLERILKRMQYNSSNPREILKVGDSLHLVLQVKQLLLPYLDKLDVVHPINQLSEKIANYADIITEIYCAIDEETIESNGDTFIQPSYDSRLQHLHQTRNNSNQLIQQAVQSAKEELGIDNVKCAKNNMIGMYFESPSRFAAKIIDNNKFIHRQTMVNTIRYTNEHLQQLDEEITNADSGITAVEQEIYLGLINEILGYSDEIIQGMQVIARLDVAASHAFIAVEHNYCRPELNDSEDLFLDNARHPVIENIYQKEQKGEFIGNDCHMDKYGQTWIITGPNMAGKSTFLRQVALITIMAQIGSFVPADKAVIGLVDQIFSRIGASDNLASGESTFMVEMKETALILNQGSSKSLIILDELGRGTSTYDGFAIAWSVLEYLQSHIKGRCLFATHFHNITEIQKQFDSIKCYCFSASESKNKVNFTYKINEGVAQSSYGTYVAKIAGVPRNVIEQAESILNNISNEDKAKFNLAQYSSNLTLPFIEEPIKNKKSKSEPKLETAPDNKMQKELNKYFSKNDINDMTPRQAMQAIFEIKDLFDKNKNN